MLWHRTDYVNLLTFGPYPGREMFVELFGPLIGLDEEWRAQGASDRELSLEAFDFDYVKRVQLGVDIQPHTGIAPVVLEETADYLLARDTMGRITRLPKGRATIALPETFPLRSAEDWPKVKHWYKPSADRIDWEAVARAKAQQAEGTVVRALMPGAYDIMRSLLGDEEACMAFAEEPDFVHDVMTTMGDMVMAAHEPVADKIVIDELFVHEDFAGRSGPLIGPDHFREFALPYYRRIWDLWSSRGTRIFDLDSDGFIEPILDALIEAGVNCIHPNEPAAGTDIVRIRQKYGKRITLRGGIDKFVLQRGEEAMRKELEYKTQACLRGGGAMFGLDHRIPNGTPLSAYRKYVEMAREILGLPPADMKRGGWARMA